MRGGEKRGGKTCASPCHDLWIQFATGGNRCSHYTHSHRVGLITILRTTRANGNQGLCLDGRLTGHNERPTGAITSTPERSRRLWISPRFASDDFRSPSSMRIDFFEIYDGMQGDCRMRTIAKNLLLLVLAAAFFTQIAHVKAAPKPADSPSKVLLDSWNDVGRKLIA